MLGNAKSSSLRSTSMNTSPNSTVSPVGLKIGDQATFAKTVAESDVYLFAGIVGDFSPIHINADYMKSSNFGQRVVHGALTFGLMSTTGTLLAERPEVRRPGLQSYSVGYDRLRFIKPVFIGDTITVTDTVSEIDEVKQRVRTIVEARNQHGVVVAAAQHLIQWVAQAKS